LIKQLVDHSWLTTAPTNTAKHEPHEPHELPMPSSTITARTEDPLSVTFAALADPTRRAILARLATGEANVNELAEPFAMSLQAVSKHLKVLERAGLITRGQHAQCRPCRLAAAPLDDAVGWIARNRQVWEDRFDQLEHHLRDIQRTDQEDDR
jgi:DNA-binding transcriptional ArsR family regulator